MRSKLNGFASPARDTVMLTFVPGSPRSLMIASVTLSSLTVRPSMLTMTSPAANARLVGRRSLDRRHHQNLAVLQVHLEADAGVVAGGADADLLVLLGIEELGMGIQVGHHAPHRVLDQAMIVHGLDVFLLDALEHLGEQAHVVPGQAVAVSVAAGEDGRCQ